MKIALKLSYLGTAYHGWQRQNNGVTIQQRIEEAIQKTCGVKVSVSGCGRTDAGQNVRLAARLTGFKIDIKSESKI